MKWDYGFPDRGLSFEYTNLYDAMRRMKDVEAKFLDFMTVFQRGGHAAVEIAVTEAINVWHPTLVFFVLFEEEVPMGLLAELRDQSSLLTFNWFCDDHWRFEDFTSRYAPLFNACSTTTRSALRKYGALGVKDVILTQWGCNHHLYVPTRKPKRIDISFVGQPHGNRREVLERLRGAGIEVRVWGTGWADGRLTVEELISVFSESRINLNLANATTQLKKRFRRARHFPEQIKARNFEIPGCAGFQLSQWATDLDRYFEPEREIVIFQTLEEMIARIEAHLRDEKLTNQIAKSGHDRVLADHTYEKRFREIFTSLGL